MTNTIQPGSDATWTPDEDKQLDFLTEYGKTIFNNQLADTEGKLRAVIYEVRKIILDDMAKALEEAIKQRREMFKP